MNKNENVELIELRSDFRHMADSQQRLEDKQEVFHTAMRSKMDTITEQMSLFNFHLLGDPKSETKGMIFDFGRAIVRLTVVEKALATGVGISAGLFVYSAAFKNIFGWF